MFNGISYATWKLFNENLDKVNELYPLLMEVELMKEAGMIWDPQLREFVYPKNEDDEVIVKRYKELRDKYLKGEITLPIVREEEFND